MDDDRYGEFSIDVEDQEEFWVVWIMKNESQIAHEMILDDCKDRNDAIRAGKDYIDAETERQDDLYYKQSDPHNEFGR